MPDTAVVILNWNGLHLLEQFLPYLVRHTDPAVADIIVADNASDDLSVDFLGDNYPSVRIIRLEKNHGFAEGYNRALKGLQYRYYMLLNSDVEVTERWLEPLADCLGRDRQIAAVMPRIRSWHDRSHFEHAGAAGGMLDRYGYPFCRGRIFNVVEVDRDQYNEQADIFWTSGACMLVRSDLFHDSGGFDAFFFAHMEEIDLCWRLQRMGYRIAYCPDSIVYHVGGATLSKANYRKTYLNFRNNFILLFKNLPPGKLGRTILTRILLDGISAVFFFIKFEFQECFAVIRAQLSILRHARTIRRLRREAAARVGDFRNDLLYPRSVVFSFYLRRIRTFSRLDRR